MAHRLVQRGPVDLEALSPRDANAQRLPKTNEVKTKTAAQLKAAKDKDHPPPIVDSYNQQRKSML